MLKVETRSGGRKQHSEHLILVRAPWTRQTGLHLLQTYNAVVESGESHCNSSSRDDRRLRPLLTTCVCSRPRSSQVGHWFRSITHHVQWPQQHPKVQKTLTSYSIWTRRQQPSHRHSFWLRQHTGLSSRSPTYYYILTFPSIYQPIGFGRAYNYNSGRKMLHNFAIWLQSHRRYIQWHICLVLVTTLLPLTSKQVRYRNRESSLSRELITEPTTKPTIESSETPTIAFTSPTTSSMLKSRQWHRRLAHMTPTAMTTLIGRYSNDYSMCTVCTQPHHKQTVIRVPVRHTTKPFELVQSHWCGTFSTPTLGDNRSYILFIDDFTRCTSVCLLINDNTQTCTSA